MSQVVLLEESKEKTFPTQELQTYCMFLTKSVIYKMPRSNMPEINFLFEIAADTINCKAYCDTLYTSIIWLF